MAEPLLPAAATIAAFVVTVASWYNLLRTSVQLIHDDIQANKTADHDIKVMLTDIKHQEIVFNDWCRRWLITDTIPNDVLQQFWGDRLPIIHQKLGDIKHDFERTRKQLKGFSDLENNWENASRFRKSLLRQKFIFSKKSYVQKLIDQWPKHMTVIEHQADHGWKDQLQRLKREISEPTPYHTLVAYSLIRIAQQSQGDVEALGHCCEAVRHNYDIVLDLDVFGAATVATIEKDAPQISEILRAGHLKIELLVREANEPDAQLVRLEVERSQGNTPEERTVDAFRAIIGINRPSMVYFSHDHSTIFGIRKTDRDRGRCSRLRQTFRDKLAKQDLPVFDRNQRKSIGAVPILDELSTYRAAFELSQACLLFLRTPWFEGICRCSIRCESISEDEPDHPHQFGLETINMAHKAPLWRNMEGDLAYSWCATNEFKWDNLNKPLRHLGLLLLELALGTIISPATDESGVAAKVTDLSILTRHDDTAGWEWFTRSETLAFVKISFPNSPRFADAIDWCLTKQFPSSPTDDVWELELRKFYFQVVKPLRDIYDMKLNNGGLAA